MERRTASDYSPAVRHRPLPHPALLRGGARGDHVDHALVADRRGVLPFVEVFAALHAIFYACSRTLYGLAEQGHAPRSILRLSRRSQIPVVPVAMMVLTGLVGVLLFLVLEDRLFFFVASIATFATVFTWLMILLPLGHVGLVQRSGPSSRV